MSIEVLNSSIPQGQSESPEEEKVQAGWGPSLDVICAKLKNPDYEVCELMRLVTVEIAKVVWHVLSLGFTVEEVHIRRRLGEGIKALRELRHSIVDAESLRKKTDVINWHGEAIKHVWSTQFSWFVKALKESGFDDGQRNVVMRSYRDLALMNEPQLHRETEASRG